MSKSDIVFQMQYKIPKNKKIAIKKWVEYATQKNKADSVSIDDYNLLKDYALYSNKKVYLTENDETFLWNQNGDISKKDVLNSIENMNNSGLYWRGFLSFPPEFAIEHGLITKMDFFSLTNNVIPTLILDMGLSLDNTEWMCTLHRDTNHPHIHFCIYEKKQTKSNPQFPKSCIHKFRSNVANYIIDNKQFYKLRDDTFSGILKKINLKDFNKIKSQNLFSDRYRKELNKMLLSFYKKIPEKGRLQYNSKNMKPCKKELDSIIEYILFHDSIKYEYANYLKLLEKHQKELNNIYGKTKSNINREYYNNQVERLYTKIGNEILENYKKYSSLTFIDNQNKFLQNHINEFNFKSRNDYAKVETKIEIAKGLYKICMNAGLNDSQTKKVFDRWNKNSKYNFNIDYLLSISSTLDTNMSTSEFYSIMKKLGYDKERYFKLKNKYFYRELNYKKFFHQAVNHLMAEIEKEEKEIINELEYTLEDKNQYEQGEI